MIGLWIKFKAYVLGIGAFLLALAGAWLYGREQGKATQKKSDQEDLATANQKAVEQVQHVQESRNETDAKVEDLPTAPAQKVADADPATAAGKLRDDGWLRS